MADLGPCDSSAAARTSPEDRLQEAVLALVLDAHPAQLSVDELRRELSKDPDDFTRRDALSNAVRDLVGAGLIHRHDAYVFATRAAVRFSELDV
jgi:hypothetical protein